MPVADQESQAALGLSELSRRNGQRAGRLRQARGRPPVLWKQEQARFNNLPGRDTT
jgi:hypothetical protein